MDPFGLKFRKACIRWIMASSSASSVSGITKPITLLERATGLQSCLSHATLLLLVSVLIASAESCTLIHMLLSLQSGHGDMVLCTCTYTSF